LNFLFALILFLNVWIFFNIYTLQVSALAGLEHVVCVAKVPVELPP
jgi:hypothetical protein